MRSVESTDLADNSRDSPSLRLRSPTTPYTNGRGAGLTGAASAVRTGVVSLVQAAASLAERESERASPWSAR